MLHSGKENMIYENKRDVSVCIIAVLVSRTREKAENRKMDEALERYSKDR